MVLIDEVAEWYLGIVHDDPATAKLVAAAIDALEVKGSALGRPLVDSIASSSIHNMKELRPGSRGRSEVRILFVFDPARRAVLLAAGDKAGQWEGWYRESIPLAEKRYAIWLAGGYNNERGL